MKEVWDKPAYGCPMTRLSLKLKLSKAEFKSWNKNVFGDVHLQVKKAQVEVDLIRAQLSSLVFSDSLHDKEVKAQQSL